MQDAAAPELLRDCEAVQIPYGSPVLLPKGTPVTVTQTLGGTVTVHAAGGLYRIATKDLDALGMKQDEIKPVAKGTVPEADEKQIWETLRTCYDPEIPVNIFDLGLIYDMQLAKLPSG